MKVALVHDYLNQYGGAERVLEALMEIFPDAPIYTLMHDAKKTGGRFAGRVTKTSFLDFPLARKKHRFFIPVMPLAAGSLNLGDNYDLIISDTAGFAKGIRYGGKTKHISYIHTPLRYAWEQKEYLSGVISNWQLVISKPILNYLKNWDYKVAQRPDVLLANSKFITGKIKNYYGREAKVVYPPVDTTQFFYRPIRTNKPINNYYLAIGRLLHYKRFDLIIKAFARLSKSQIVNSKLLIVGSGPEKAKLQLLVTNYQLRNVELIDFVHDENKLRALYAGAKALIFPQVEDFGLVAAEAQACGTPVIAYAAGGAMEIVEDVKTGVLFNAQTVESLAEAIVRAEKSRFNRANIAKAARRFSKENFKNELLKLIRRV